LHVTATSQHVNAVALQDHTIVLSSLYGAFVPASRQARPDIVHSSLYLPEPVYEALREAAFKERCKIHDLVMQGIDLALRKRGYPSVDDLRAGGKR
jgi:hypothetical protein